MKIITNNKPRALVYGYELTDKEKQDFDYMEDMELESFVRYQGMTFAISDFMRLSGDSYEAKQGWHGVYGMNAFCGILIKLDSGSEYAVMGKVIC